MAPPSRTRDATRRDDDRSGDSSASRGSQSDSRPDRGRAYQLRITANQVTVARLVPMPAIAWLLYQGTPGEWVALVVGAVIAFTDWVDGYLARKQGPTVLGGLLDPMADKVFVALAYLPYTDLGVLPIWPVALMFVREFVVTALRSAYEQRGLSLTTSYLAKMKTWVQMQAIGTIILLRLVDRPVMLALIVAGLLLPLLLVAWLRLGRGYWFRGGLVMAGWLALLLLLYLPFPVAVTLHTAAWIVCAMSWLSGAGYALAGMRQLRGRGSFDLRDLVRLTTALALPVLLFAALRLTAAPIAALAAILAIELAVGGLDNLMEHHRRRDGETFRGGRALLVCALLAAALWRPAGLPASTFALAACAVSALGSALAFWQGRKLYAPGLSAQTAR
jgi:CDP-diacylglycerol--glycerol-3-phosphate 3-phosphatidyltransferase